MQSESDTPHFCDLISTIETAALVSHLDLGGLGNDLVPSANVSPYDGIIHLKALDESTEDRAIHRLLHHFQDLLLLLLAGICVAWLGDFEVLCDFDPFKLVG